VKFKLAILNVLAASPGRHLTLDEVRRKAELLVALEGHSDQLKRFSVLGDIDIFQSGLVSQDDAGLQITDAGRALSHSLEGASKPDCNRCMCRCRHCVCPDQVVEVRDRHAPSRGFALKGRLARLEQAKKTKLDLDQQEARQNQPGLGSRRNMRTAPSPPKRMTLLKRDLAIARPP
jgi:hypothetical protein